MGETKRKVIAAIYGSGRVNGNSETLLNEALDGAEDDGYDVHRLYLRDLIINACQNCGKCNTYGVCQNVEDDMKQVYELIDRADLILVSTPIYFCNVASQVKAMVDRAQQYWVRTHVLKHPPVRTERKGGFVACGGFKDDRFLACTEQVMRTWYFTMNIEYKGCFFAPGLDEYGAAQKRPDILEKAAEYGRKFRGAGVKK